MHISNDTSYNILLYYIKNKVKLKTIVFGIHSFYHFSIFVLLWLKCFMVMIHLLARRPGSRRKTLFIRIFWNVNAENEGKFTYRTRAVLWVGDYCFTLLSQSQSSNGWQFDVHTHESKYIYRKCCLYETIKLNAPVTGWNILNWVAYSLLKLC